MYVHSLKLENIKVFEQLELDFVRPDGSYQGMNVFVGGNASGKTTILKSIAMAVSGRDTTLQLISTTVGWISKSMTYGHIEIEAGSEYTGSENGETIATPLQRFLDFRAQNEEEPDSINIIQQGNIFLLKSI